MSVFNLNEILHIPDEDIKYTLTVIHIQDFNIKLDNEFLLYISLFQ